MSPMEPVPDDIAAQVEQRLAEGWRPAKSVERTWVRGALRRQVGDDLVEDLEGAETETMTEAEEAELIRRTYAGHG